MNNSAQNISRSKARAEVLEKHEYTIIRELGQGNSGRAFLVKNPEEDFLVVKEIYYRHNRNFNLEAVKNEIDVLKNLHHGYVVGYEGSFEDRESGFFYIVSEYCAGGDLFKMMQTQNNIGFFEEQQILEWLVQICLALQYLHKNNVLHRDIKPQNVFLTEDGYINLGDFGCSKVRQSADEYATSVVGAELYTSPEIYQNRHNSKSDIWSLGWLIHDLCMLDVWSNIIERRCVHANSLRGTKPDISNRYSNNLQTLIKEMLSCDPRDRPSADEILAKPFLSIAVIKNKGIPDVLQRNLKKSIRTFNEAYNKHFKNFETSVKEWERTTDSLESIHYKATAGSLSGAVIGAAGGITALVGAVLAPFTFGASLIVAGVGIGVGVAGSATGAASNITNSVKQKSLRARFEKIQQDYKTASEPILNSLKALRKLLRKITRFRDFVPNSDFDHAQTAWRIGRTAAAGITELVTLGMLLSFGKIAIQAAGVGRAVAAASGVLSSVLVIADVAFIVRDSREIHQMNQQWRTDNPENVTSPVLKAIAQMRKAHIELCNVLEVIKETREKLNRPNI
ncbi:serine/threonine-protein kinase ppk11-like [Megalobrama amblycephala]|uniref:serine/threonine-protein kinase ppk11-like n=1 Tax=Megalobrama amblycephala TaxID=75352 RepID=UPI0020147293|nr:serine/threonine-protein kinase ppk11-like [Megalobrama amblycephala]XP_048035566.1 serine/threonine-protein kinase ppk11-like [Megalobrama amblycephala]XP_048035567.1 serine/threonine-protein kinase ppk11-like [Megalobrama amblycephala]XP_048035568.1 serine/threonine-protein kinase ppk11-like [Megalobrama amblycephala]